MQPALRSVSRSATVTRRPPLGSLLVGRAPAVIRCRRHRRSGPGDRGNRTPPARPPGPSSPLGPLGGVAACGGACGLRVALVVEAPIHTRSLREPFPGIELSDQVTTAAVQARLDAPPGHRARRVPQPGGQHPHHRPVSVFAVCTIGPATHGVIWGMTGIIASVCDSTAVAAPPRMVANWCRWHFRATVTLHPWSASRDVSCSSAIPQPVSAACANV